MVGAVSDAPSAVNAEFIYNMGFSVVYPDRLCGAVLDTVNAPLTGGFLQADRADKFVFVQ